jgi:hypothetical protein
MPVIDIPDPLPPAITPDREVIELLIERHLAEFGGNSLVAAPGSGSCTAAAAGRSAT